TAAVRSVRSSRRSRSASAPNPRMTDMPLDPQVAGLLAVMADQPRVELSDATVADVRTTFDTMTAFGAGEPPAVRDSIEADADGVPVRIVTPLGAGPVSGRPVVVYVHGGGWTIGSAAAYEPFTRLLASET